MRPRLAALCAATALFAAGAAAAQTTLLENDFEQICLGMTDVDDAHAKARAAGFVTAPAQLTKGAPREGVTLTRTEEGRMMLVLLLRQKQRVAAPFRRVLVLETCAVSSMPGQPNLEKSLEAWLGVGRLQMLGLGRTFVYRQTAQGRVRLEGPPQVYNASADAGDLRMVVAKRNDMLTVIAPHPEVR